MTFSIFRKQCEELVDEKAKFLEVPAKGQADLALPCFKLVEEGKKFVPSEIAKKLQKNIKLKMKKIKNSLIKDVKAEGPYLNFYIDEKKYTPLVLDEILAKDNFYGSQPKKAGRIILEHTSFNPSGPVHIGRLRNSVIGDSIKRLLKFTGHNVETQYFVNDIGKQIAMIAWALREGIQPDFELMDEYKEYKDKPDFGTMFIYVAANKLLEKNPEQIKDVEKILVECESKPKVLEELVKISRNCLAGQIKSLENIGIEFDKFMHESKFVENKSVKDVIKKLSTKAKKEGEALILDLSKYGLRDKIYLTREDGTSTYILRDLAYHLEKSQNTDKLINVLGEDHKIEAHELLVILREFLKVKKPIDVTHFSFVNFQGLKLSTRKGRIASLDQLLDEGIEASLAEIKKREKIEINIDHVAREIAVASIKYHLLRYDPLKSITFVWKDVINFEGNSGAYLQYTHARANSILEKAKESNVKMKINQLNKDEEMELVKMLGKFSEVIKSCVSSLKSTQLANYLFELCQKFNEYYQNVRVLGTDEASSRLSLVYSVKTVLANGLDLLGIEPLEKM